MVVISSPSWSQSEAEAGVHPLPVDVDGARAALPVIAPFLRAGEMERFAQRIQQRAARVDLNCMLRAVHRKGDLHKTWRRGGSRGLRVGGLGEGGAQRHGARDDAGGAEARNEVATGKFAGCTGVVLPGTSALGLRLGMSLSTYLVRFIWDSRKLSQRAAARGTHRQSSRRTDSTLEVPFALIA